MQANATQRRFENNFQARQHELAEAGEISEAECLRRKMCRVRNARRLRGEVRTQLDIC